MAFVNAGGIASLSKAGFDSLMNGVIENIDGSLLQAQAIQAFLLANPDANFTAAAGGPGPTGYAAGDVSTFKSAFSDMDQLRQIYQGLATLGTAKDFRSFTKLIATLIH